MSEEVLTPFDYDSLDEETRTFVLRKTAETHGWLKRTAEEVIMIGRNLAAVKQRLPHGQFLLWLQAEFGMSDRHARRFMLVAEKFGTKSDILSDFPASVLYELAPASDNVIEQVVSGQIPPTLAAIQAAKKAEQQARQEAAEQELERLRIASQARVADLTTEIERLQHQVAELAASKVETKEVPVVSPEMSAHLATLRSQVQTLTQQRDTLSRRVTELGEQARAAAMQRGEAEGERRIRLTWRQATAAFQQNILKLLAQWPSPLDAQVFEAEDWTHLAQVKDTAHRVLSECQRLSQGIGGQVVDAAPPRNGAQR